MVAVYVTPAAALVPLFVNWIVPGTVLYGAAIDNTVIVVCTSTVPMAVILEALLFEGTLSVSVVAMVVWTITGPLAGAVKLYVIGAAGVAPSTFCPAVSVVGKAVPLTDTTPVVLL